MEHKILLPLLDEAAGYALKHGKVTPDEPLNFDTGMDGSDAGYVRIQGTVRSLQRNGFEIRMKDTHESRSSGTYSLDWSEVGDRTLEMYLHKKKVVEAKKCLGGKQGWSGMFSSEKKEIKPTDWIIEKAASLDNVVKHLEEIRESLSENVNFNTFF